MRNENEIQKKEIIIKKIHTWDLLHEVDKLVEHIPNWKKFDWDINVKRIYMEGHKNQFGNKNWNKKKRK